MTRRNIIYLFISNSNCGYNFELIRKKGHICAHAYYMLIIIQFSLIILFYYFPWCKSCRLNLLEKS